MKQYQEVKRCQERCIKIKEEITQLQNQIERSKSKGLQLAYALEEIWQVPSHTDGGYIILETTSYPQVRLEVEYFPGTSPPYLKTIAISSPFAGLSGMIHYRAEREKLDQPGWDIRVYHEYFRWEEAVWQYILYYWQEELESAQRAAEDSLTMNVIEEKENI